MDKNQKKELFSKAFIKAVSAQTGFRTAEPDVDDDSIDIIVRGRGYRGPIRNPQIDVQLKCTAKDEGSSGNLKFSLPLKNYNDLRGNNVACPRYLFVFVAPEDCEDWLVHERYSSQIKHCCYWYSLLGLSDVSNSTNVTIYIPRTQRLTSDSMSLLLELASEKNVA